jgi:hypothetical protein
VDRWASHPEAEPGKLAVALSALLPTTADPAWTECGLFEAYYEKIRPATAPSVVELLEQTDQQFTEFAPVLKLATPSKSLVDGFHEVTSATA